MFVTDTHPLIWYSTGKHPQLSRKALAAFQKAEASENLIYIPAVVFWEIALLENLGKIKLNQRFLFFDRKNGLDNAAANKRRRTRKYVTRFLRKKKLCRSHNKYKSSAVRSNCGS